MRITISEFWRGPPRVGLQTRLIEEALERVRDRIGRDELSQWLRARRPDTHGQEGTNDE